LSGGTCLQKNRRIAVCEVQNAFGILFGTLSQSILKGNIEMYVMATELVSCLLSELQKEIHVITYQDSPERLKGTDNSF
jgi:hypothetical protein